MEILNPSVTVKASVLESAPKLTSLKGLRIGFLDNAKANVGIFYDRLEQLFAQDKTYEATFLCRKKQVAASPAPRAMLEELATKCDIVIVGFAD